jgi:pimeloyl-ACP methyl ester carboxylesterase
MSDLRMLARVIRPGHGGGDLSGVTTSIPGCRLATIEAGHLVHEERPGEFGAEVAAFLS